MEQLLSNPIRYAKETLAGLFKYAFGKGIVTLGVMGATLMSGGAAAGAIATIWPVVAGFIGWKMFRLHSRYTSYKDTMIDLYREEIAQTIGCAPEAVTREHLRVMAAGDPVVGIPPNPIIAEALNKQRGSALLSFTTAILAAATTLTLLTFGLNENASEFIKNAFPDITDMAKKVGVSAISGLSGLIVHNGLDTAIGQAMGYFRATAHDRIALIAHRKSYGVTITPQHVFDVFMAADPDLARTISTTFNKGFTGFTNKEKLQAMKAIGIDEAMKELADQINKNELHPGALAFELGELINYRTAQRDAASMEKGPAASRSANKEHTVVQKTSEQETPNRPRFTDRVHSRMSHAGSHIQAEEARRAAALQAPAHHL